VVKKSEIFKGHIPIQVNMGKILQLDVPKNQFSNFCNPCYINGSFECFLAEKGLGPLGLN